MSDMESLNEMMGYTKARQEKTKEIAKIAKKSGSKTAKAAQNSRDPKVEKKCEMVNMLVREALDLYEMGTMSYSEMVDDLYETLKAVE